MPLQKICIAARRRLSLPCVASPYDVLALNLVRAAGATYGCAASTVATYETAAGVDTMYAVPFSRLDGESAAGASDVYATVAGGGLAGDVAM